MMMAISRVDKRCVRCDAVKDATDFYRNRSRADGLSYWCKQCTAADKKSRRDRENERQRTAHAANPQPLRDAVRKSRLKTKFGISVEQYDEMFRRQDGVCAICGLPPKKRRLCIDHDHITGKIRALLCTPCNGSLHVLENPQLLKLMMEYLDQHKEG